MGVDHTTHVEAERPADPVERRAPGRHHDGPPILQARERGVATWAGGRMSGHPVIAFVAVTMVGFLLLAALTILGGWLLKTYVLPDHGIGHADEHANVWLAQHRDSTRNDISFYLSGIGDVLAIPALVAITVLVAALKRWWRVAGFILAAIALEAATYRAATLTIHRLRPRVPRLDQLPVNESYYSGHTGASIAVYCGIALVITSMVRNTAARAACWVVAVAIPVLVALSRLYRGMHHPTDVMAAALVGIGCLVVAVAAARAADAATAREARS